MHDTEKRLGDIVGVPLSYHTITINGYDIRYVKAGAGLPLVLIHGGNLGWGHWYPNIAELSKHFTVYALDLPGGGRSTKIDFKRLNFEKDLVDTVDVFIQKLNLQSVFLVGASMGGWVAMKVALKNGDKIKKIVVADSVGFSSHMTFPDLLMSWYPFARFMSKTVLRPGAKNRSIENFLRKKERLSLLGFGYCPKIILQ